MDLGQFAYFGRSVSFSEAADQPATVTKINVPPVFNSVTETLQERQPNPKLERERQSQHFKSNFSFEQSNYIKRDVSSIKINQPLPILTQDQICGSKVDSAFHPSKLVKMSTRNFWKLSGKK